VRLGSWGDNDLLADQFDGLSKSIN